MEKNLRIKILIGILLVTVVGVNWWNNTRPPVEYVAITDQYSVDKIIQQVINVTEDNCFDNGYLIINRHLFMCVPITNIPENKL